MESALYSDLRRIVKGDVYCDDLHRTLYSTAACIFQIMPQGVVVPKDRDDVVAVVQYAAEKGIPVTARGAGSGLAGQTLGEGIILDESLHPETNMFDRSILLHELVHYIQDMSGYYGNADACNRWFHRELNAYEIQNRYLGAIGHPSRVAYAGNNCHAMDAMGQDGITRRQVFSGATRHPDTED